MRILITNDDGIEAAGIKALSEGFSKAGHDVWTVAPAAEQSGASHKLTLGHPLRLREVGPQRYGVDGTPTDAVYMAVHHIMPERPELLVSGINHGPNLGDDVTYSGTVAAAIEGTVISIPSIAVSLVSHHDFLWDKSVEFAVKLAEKVKREGLPAGTLLNVNVPLHPIETNGISWKLTRQGKRNYGQYIVKRSDPRGRAYFWIGGDASGAEHIDGSDIEAVEAGLISVTPLSIDLTDYAALKSLRSWEGTLS